LREFPEAAKQFSSGLSQHQETPLQVVQRRKLEQELKEAESERSFLDRLTVDLEAGEEFEETAPRKTAKKPKFSFEDPSSWTNKQIDNFRSYEGKNSKGKISCEEGSK
jgi:hypothetical protein